MELLERAKGGDDEAVNQLLTRYVGPLCRWASGRLPRWARDMSDTQDLVQETVIRTLKHLSDFQPSRDGALHAYLRKALMNRIRDEFRRAHRHPTRTELVDEFPAADASPFDRTSTREAMERYEAALLQLRDDEREIVIARVDFDLTYQQIAAAFARPSTDAA